MKGKGRLVPDEDSPSLSLLSNPWLAPNIINKLLCEAELKRKEKKKPKTTEQADIPGKNPDPSSSQDSSIAAGLSAEICLW